MKHVHSSNSDSQEAVTIVDVLRRAKLNVTLCAVVSSDTEAKSVVCSRGVNITADHSVKEIGSPADVASRFSCIVLPGGLEGAKTFKSNEWTQSCIREFSKQDKVIGAICAAPMALAEAGIIAGKQITSHPVAKDDLTAGNYVERNVVQDGKIITSRCPGTSFEFALHLIKILVTQDVSEEVRKGLFVHNQ
jgi:protein deglycase